MATLTLKTEEDSTVGKHVLTRSVSMNSEDEDIVNFADGDPENPHNWPALRRWLTVVAVSLMAMISVFATTVVVPAAPQVLDDFHVHDKLYATLLVTMWDLGEGVSPFAAGPLSEKFGRSPIFHIGNLLGLLCTIAGALSINISMFIAFRFLGGFFLTAPTLASAMTADVVRPEERGSALAISMSLRLIAPFAAPISGAYINQSLGWRWIIRILTIAMGSIVILSLLVIRESYAAKILEKKADILRRETGNTQLRPKHQLNVDKASFWNGITRPIQLLFHSLTVSTIAFYAGLAVGVQYLIVTTLTTAMERTYSFSQGSVGLTFIAPCTGFLVGIVVYGMTSDRYMKYKKEKDGGKMEPKHRLLHLFIGSVTFPVGLLLYGWTLSHRIFYVVPLIGTGITGFSLLMIALAANNYLVDTFELYAASAVSALTIMQALLGAIFPLAGPPLYNKLGYGWGNSVLALMLAIFIPFLGVITTQKRQKVN